MTESPLISNRDPMGKNIPKTLPSQLPSAVPKIQKPPSSGNSKLPSKSKTATPHPLLLHPKTKKKSIFNPQLLPTATQNESRLEVMHYELKKKSLETAAAESRRKPLPEDDDDDDWQVETNKKRTVEAKRRPETAIRKPQKDTTKEKFPEEEETEKPVRNKAIPVTRVSVRQDGVALENKRVSPERRRSERQIEKKSMDIENRKESLSKEKSKDTPKGSKQKDKQKDSKQKDSNQKDSKRKDSQQKDNKQKDINTQPLVNKQKRRAVTTRQEAVNRKNSIESEGSVSKEKEKPKTPTKEVKTRTLKKPTLAPPKQQPKPAETKIDLDTRKEMLEEAHKRKSYRRLVPFPGHKSALLPGNLKPKRDTYNVEEILDKKMFGKVYKYLIKWEGYPDEENSWEPRNYLPKEMVDEFEESARDRLGASSGRVEEEAEDNNEKQEETEERHQVELMLEDLKPKAEILKPKTLKEAGENMVPVVKRSKERKGVEQVLEQKDASYEEEIEEELEENIEESNNKQKEVAIIAEPNEEGKTNVEPTEEKKPQTENLEDVIMKNEEEKNEIEKIPQESMEIEQENKETTVENKKKSPENNNNSQKEPKPDINDCDEAERNSKHQLPTMSKKIKKILKKNNKAVGESSSRAVTSKKTGKKYDDPDPMVINSDAEGLSSNRASKFGDFRQGDSLKVIRKIRYNKKLRAVYALVEWNERANGYVPLSSKVDLENLKAHAPSETINFLISILVGKGMNGN